jgi:hypothetical protein
MSPPKEIPMPDRTLRSIRRLLSLIAIWCSFAAAVTAQPEPGAGPRWPRYDKTTEMTIEGTVKEVLRPDDGRGRKGMHLMIEAAEQTWTVHLGPASWVQAKGFSFAAGDAVTVFGSRIEVDGKPVLIAREVTKGDAKLELRDESGNPLWAGRRH